MTLVPSQRTQIASNFLGSTAKSYEAISQSATYHIDVIASFINTAPGKYTDFDQRQKRRMWWKKTRGCLKLLSPYNLKVIKQTALQQEY